MEVAGANGHGALHCEVERCQSAVTKPLQGTRHGVLTTWRLCLRHTGEMRQALAEKGERVLSDGWGGDPTPPSCKPAIPPAERLAAPALAPRRSAAPLTTLPPAVSAAPPPRAPLRRSLAQTEAGNVPSGTADPAGGTPSTPTTMETPMPIPGSRTRPTHCLVPRCTNIHLAHGLCGTDLGRAKKLGMPRITGLVTDEQIKALAKAAAPAKAAPAKRKAAKSAGLNGDRALALLEAAPTLVPDEAVPPPAPVVFWKEEAAGLQARLDAVNAALDVAGVDLDDKLEEGPAVALLARRLHVAEAALVGVGAFAELLGLPPGASALAVADAIRQDGAKIRALRDLAETIAEELGLPSECDDSEILAEVARLVQIEKPDIVITPDELRRRVVALDAAEDAAEEAERLEARAREAREEERGFRARALGLDGGEVANG